jgi:hypothetical protein
MTLCAAQRKLTRREINFRAPMNGDKLMDPNTVLDSLRTLAEYLRDEDAGVVLDYAEETADAFQALDSWLSNGGFLPHDWERKDATQEVP